MAKNPFENTFVAPCITVSYELHQPEQAEAYLLKAQENADDQEEILLRLATIYQEQERYEDILALEAYEPENLLTKWMNCPVAIKKPKNWKRLTSFIRNLLQN